MRIVDGYKQLCTLHSQLSTHLEGSFIMKKTSKKVLSLVLSVLLCIGVFPLTPITFASDTSVLSDRDIYLSTKGLKDPTPVTTDQGTYYQPNSYVYYGSDNGERLKWRVLDNDKSNNPNIDGLFLLSEHLISGSTSFDEDGVANSNQDYPAVWRGSLAQDWIFRFSSGSSGNFWGTEFDSILSPDKLDSRTTLFGSTWDPSELTLDDIAFMLSTQEVHDYLGTYNRAPGLVATNTDGEADHWWLRSPYDLSAGGNKVASVSRFGDVNESTVTADYSVRPALNVVLSQIALVTPASGNKIKAGLGELTSPSSYYGNEWKLTLFERSAFDIAETSVNAEIGSTFDINYSHASTGENQYISAIICDNDDNILYYGQIANNSNNGTATVTVPKDLELGTYKLKIFDEIINGDKMSDYASPFEEIPLNIVKNVNSIEVTDVQVPVNGELMNSNFTVSGDTEWFSSYYLDWYVSDTAPKTFDDITNICKDSHEYGSRYLSGKYYTVVAEFEAKPNYFFPDDITITINGNNVVAKEISYDKNENCYKATVIYTRYCEYPEIENHTDHTSYVEWTDSTALPSASGCYYLSTDVTLNNGSYGWYPANGIVLCLNGHTIKNESSKRAIQIKDGVTFTLCDCSGDNGKVTVAGDGAIEVLAGGTFNMYGGTLTGSNCNHRGGGADVQGTFNMYGGKITGNTMRLGGGVYIRNLDTTATQSAVFNMYGGEISNNTVTENGGGVYMESGTVFNMYGGVISGNQSSNENGLGSAVYITNENNENTTLTTTAFNMTGGEIKDNTTNSYGCIYATGTGTNVSVSGSSVISNNSAFQGEFAYIQNGASLTLSGAELVLNGKGTTDETHDSIINLIHIDSTSSLTINEDCQLNLVSNDRLYVDGTATNNGTINNNGRVYNEGSVINNGTIVNNNKISNDGTITNNNFIYSAGTLYNGNTGNIVNNGRIHNAGEFDNSGQLTGNAVVNLGVGDVIDDTENSGLLFKVLTVDTTSGTVEVMKKGDDDIKSEYTETSYTVPETITRDGITFTVTDIGEKAFFHCTTLTNVYLPDTITTIGKFAFYCCYKLDDSIYLDNVTTIKDYAFTGCFAFEEFTIPKGVTEIPIFTFNDCRNLKSVTLHDGVTSIGNYAFWDCCALDNVVLPDNMNSIGEFVFWECTSLKNITLPLNLTSISNGTFMGCTQLNYVAIPFNVTSIGERAFINCTSLKGIILPQNVRFINQSAFEGCTSLEYAVIEGTYVGTDIGESAFKGCTSLKELGLGFGVMNIANNAFKDCTALEDVIFPDSLETIGDYAFENCTSVSSVVFMANGPLLGTQNITVGKGAFKNCVSLESIQIPTVKDTTPLGEEAFMGCTSLKNVFIPNGLSTIGASAFSGCTSLEILTLTSSITTVGDNAFLNCDALSDIFFYGIREEWDAITKGTDNEALSNATLSLFANSAFDDAQSGLRFSVIGRDSATTGSVAVVRNDNNTEQTSFIVPSTVVNEGITYTVTEIGDRAFAFRKNLTSVTLPDTITIVKRDAFNECFALTNINIPESLVYAGSSAFWGFELVQFGKIRLPNLRYVSESAFSRCTNINELELSGELLFIESNSFFTTNRIKKLVLPAGLRYIGANAFAFCSDLAALYIPESLKYINDSAFYRRIFPETNIYYYGDAEQWDDITIHNRQNELLFDTPVHCIYDVTFEYNDHKTANTMGLAYRNGNLLAIPAPTRDGFIFKGWYDSLIGGNRVDSNTVFSDHTTVYAHWESVVGVDTEKVLCSYNDLISYNIVGDNVKFQWYATNSETGSPATLVRGATKDTFSLTQYLAGKETKYKYFYCVATVTENGTTTKQTSKLCLNGLTLLQEADCSVIDYENKIIYTDCLNNVGSYAGIVCVADGGNENVTISVTPSYNYGTTKSYGTGSVVTITGDVYSTDFTVIVFGDVNGDGVVDVLDTTATSLASTGKGSLTGLYNIAVDINGDGIIDVTDYSEVVNKSLS